KRYVNVRVLEMSIGTCALMMRCCDSWVNATQILGLACIRKSDRTKTLKRDIWTGEHQKVQGGNFKYQGTWISYERSIILCRQYGLEYLPALLLHHGFNPRATETPYENYLVAVNHGLSREIKQEIKEEFKAQIKEEPWDAGGLNFKVTIEPDVLKPAFGRL
ncbi:transcriptional regulator swi6, partial [Neofusicoccum ribis]